jgi:P4 family phage/plasmid primase-like protien
LRESIDILKAEFGELLSSDRERLDDITHVRASQQRIDSYTLLLRDLLVKSSLCYLNGELSFFDGRSYVVVSPKRASDMLCNLLIGYGVSPSDTRRIGDMPFLVLSEREYKIDRSKVCFENCVLDMKTGDVLDFGTSIHTDYVRPFSYSEDVKYPMWKRFLDEVLPDEDEQSCLQEFFGMCFLDRDRYSVEKFAMFIGTGSNGKSVVFDVIKAVIGKEYVSFLDPTQLMDAKNLIDVDGKRLNFAPDIRKGASFDSALKALSSGQEVTGWEMYKGGKVVKCPPLVFAMNELPRFRDVTSAFFRRILLFSFDVTIPEERQDKSLAARIVKYESAGVFRWMMEGLWRMQERLRDGKREFTSCEKMASNLELLKKRVRNEENPVLQYLDNAGWSVEPMWMGQEPEKVRANDLYSAMQGRVSMNAIARELTSLNVKKVRASSVTYYLYRKD